MKKITYSTQPYASGGSYGTGHHAVIMALDTGGFIGQFSLTTREARGLAASLEEAAEKAEGGTTETGQEEA
jgi:hypothetical protein